MLKYKYVFDIGLDRSFMYIYKKLILFLFICFGLTLGNSNTAFSSELRSSYINEVLDDYENDLISEDELRNELRNLRIYNCPYFSECLEEENLASMDDLTFREIFCEYGGLNENFIYIEPSDNFSIATSSKCQRIASSSECQEIDKLSKYHNLSTPSQCEKSLISSDSNISKDENIKNNKVISLKKYILKSYFYKIEDGNLKLFKNQPFIDGDNILINLYFNIPNYKSKRKIEYILPKEFHVEDGLSALIYTDNMKCIGEFYVDKMGKIHIRYLDKDFKQEQDSSIYAIISLKGKLLLPDDVDRRTLFFGGEDGFIDLLKDEPMLLNTEYGEEYIPPTGISMPFKEYIFMIFGGLLFAISTYVYGRGR